MITQTMLYDSSNDMKAAWKNTAINVGVQTQNNLASGGWTLTDKISPSATDQILAWRFKSVGTSMYNSALNLNGTFAVGMNPVLVKNTTTDS